jgi:transcription-repair coupling factor (superfamily II helicase)
MISKENILEIAGRLDLQKGDIIPAEELSKAFGIRKDSIKYLYAVNALRLHYERQGLILKQEDFGIHILTDTEGSKVNAKRFFTNINTSRKKLKIQRSIDTSGFTQDQKEYHHKAISIMDRMMQPITDVVKEARLLNSSLRNKTKWPKIGPPV